MGGTTSKIEAPVVATDYSKAQFSADYVDSALRQANEAAQKTATEATEQVNSLSSRIFGLSGFVGFLFLGGFALLVYFILARFNLAGVSSFFGLKVGTDAPSSAPRSLLLHTATQNGRDMSIPVGKLIVGETLSISPPVSSSLPIDPPTSGTALPNPLILNYQFSDDTVSYTYFIADDSQPVNISSSSNPGTATNKSTTPTNNKATAPTSSSGFFGSLFSGNGGSGTLVSSMLDTTNSSVVKSTSAPLSNGGSGAYGMQWWMFIKDWNYGYGKDKQVLARADPTNTQILNPSVALHPTDNSMRITVSVFPDNSGASSKTQPAPAGHSGSTDDVFICEVPNLPLQDWFSVSLTVFGRNLDVYIDGKLVKSCLLPGVPKPASGDITVAGNGGFSGSLCNFNHYSRMLAPADAASFYSAGTSCKSSTGPSTASTATGYAVKFGVYDTVGKKIQEYTF